MTDEGEKMMDLDEMVQCPNCTRLWAWEETFDAAVADEHATLRIKPVVPMGCPACGHRWNEPAMAYDEG